MGVDHLQAWSLLPVTLFALLAAAGSVGAEVAEAQAADLGVIENPECAGESRTLVRFELPESIAGATIEFAVLEFEARVASTDEAGVASLEAFPVTTDWSGDAVAWSDGWDTPGGDFDTQVHAVWTAVSGESSVVRFDVTDMMNGWASGTSRNHGLVVRGAPGETTGVAPVGAADGSDAPRLRVYYTRPDRCGPR